MIKARIKNPYNGRVYMVIGFTEEDLAVMRGGSGHMLIMEQLGMQAGEPNNLMFVYAPTNQALEELLSKVKPFPTGLIFPPRDEMPKAPEFLRDKKPS